MKNFRAWIGLTIALVAMLPWINTAHAQGRRRLPSRVSKIAARLKPIESLPSTNRLRLVIGLPFRNPEALTNLLEQLYDPGSPQFRQWLTPEEFNSEFGPTKADYAKVIHFAQAHGLTVTGTHSNRVLLDVIGPVGAVERAFQVNAARLPAPDGKADVLRARHGAIGGIRRPHPACQRSQ